MIFSCLLLFFFVSIINANEQHHIGIINHNTQWYIHCGQSNTRIKKPPLNDQPLLSYPCPYPSLSVDILPIEIDFTLICRLQPRLIWIMIDLYQYNLWSRSINVQELNISLKLNENIQSKDFKSEITKYNNRFIIINAFYIPFESLDILLNKTVEILIQMNQCRFYIKENLTWNDMISKDCNSIESKTLNVQYGQCDFYSKSIPMDTNLSLQVENFDNDNNTTEIPDFNVVLSIDGGQQQPIETTTHFLDFHSSFDEHYQKIFSNLATLTRTSNLIPFVFIFTIIILIILIILFIYILFYHYHIRSIRKSSLLI